LNYNLKTSNKRTKIDIAIKTSSLLHKSELQALIHSNSSSQKGIIERLENKISEFELKVQSYEFKLQNLKKNCQMHLSEVATLKVKV
jgi:hypothetical protein